MPENVFVDVFVFVMYFVSLSYWVVIVVFV